MTFIAGLNGRALVKEAFGNVFREWANEAGVPKSAHGLRKAAATADAMDGFTDAELDAKFRRMDRPQDGRHLYADRKWEHLLAAAPRTG